MTHLYAAISKEAADQVETFSLLHVKFEDSVFDGFVDVFGHVPAPWPLFPIELDIVVNRDQIYRSGIDLYSMSFYDWPRVELRPLLRETLAHLFPIDFYSVDAVLIPGGVELDYRVVETLDSILDAEPAFNRQILAAVTAATELGWCALTSWGEGNSWLFFFRSDYCMQVVTLKDTFKSHCAHVCSRNGALWLDE